MAAAKKHFIIVGESRLAIRLSTALAGQDTRITLIRIAGETHDAQGHAPDGVQVIESASEREAETLAACDAQSATCLLPVGDNDLTNLRWAVIARKTAPKLPIVLRVFDQSLADQLEIGLHIRRAFSVSALSAPAFIAAACKADVIETLRIGDEEAPICRVRVEPDSFLEGMTVAELRTRYGCTTIALTEPSGAWVGVRSDGVGVRLLSGQSVMLGGPLANVLRLLCLKAGWLSEEAPTWRDRLRPMDIQFPRWRLGSRVAAVLWAFVALLFIATLVFEASTRMHPIDAAYFAAATATTSGYGDLSLEKAPDWLKIFGIAYLLASAALLGVLFSNLAARLTAERLEDVMGRRAARTHDHVVVAGLGNLGYRVAKELLGVGLKVVAIERKPDSTFAGALRQSAPVLSGDARLEDTLERAGMTRSRALISCMDDDLANVQACLHARRINADVATVARVHSDALAESLAEAFEFDAAISSSGEAVSAFVGAALDNRALRVVEVGEEEYHAARVRISISTSGEQSSAWRRDGARILAVRRANGAVQPSDLARAGMSLERGDEIAICGPAPVVDRIIRSQARVQTFSGDDIDVEP